MTSNCYYCHTEVTESNCVLVVVGSNAEKICLGCDDRIYSYTQDELDEYGSVL